MKKVLIGIAAVLLLMFSLAIFAAATDNTTSSLTGGVEVATPAP